MNTKIAVLLINAMLITNIAFSQVTDSARRGGINRTDNGTQITTTSRQNVPRNQRAQPVQSAYRPTNALSGTDKPDVLLDIPNVSVDEITLEVTNLQAHVALDARVANLVKLTAGVDASIDNVKLTIKGVQATVLLIVRLDNVRAIIEKTLDLLNNNPQIVDKLLSTVDNTVNTVGNIANTALQPGGVISQTVNTLGQTVQRTLDMTGNIVEKTLDTTGKVVSSKTLGRLLDLPLVSETTNAAGQTVKKLRDTTGKIIEVVVDKSGKIVSSGMGAAQGAAGQTTGGQ